MILLLVQRRHGGKPWAGGHAGWQPAPEAAADVARRDTGHAFWCAFCIVSIKARKLHVYAVRSAGLCYELPAWTTHAFLASGCEIPDFTTVYTKDRKS